MEYLLKLFVKYYNFFLFLLLQVICFYLIIHYHEHHRAVFWDNAYEISGWVYDQTESVNSYLNLRQVNDSLRAENARLREQAESSFYRSLHHIGELEDEVLKDQFKYISARVINNSVNRPNNFITLDRGTMHDVEPPAGVITANGVAGILTHASRHFSAGISALHQEFNLSVQIEESGYIGSLSWEGNAPNVLRVTDIPRHKNVREGQKVVTSPYSRLFPEGIEVGEIFHHEVDPITNFHIIRIRPSVAFEDLRYGYIIHNTMAEEQVQLENQAR